MPDSRKARMPESKNAGRVKAKYLRSIAPSFIFRLSAFPLPGISPSGIFAFRPFRFPAFSLSGLFAFSLSGVPALRRLPKEMTYDR